VAQYRCRESGHQRARRQPLHVPGRGVSTHAAAVCLGRCWRRCSRRRLEEQDVLRRIAGTSVLVCLHGKTRELPASIALKFCHVTAMGRCIIARVPNTGFMR